MASCSARSLGQLTRASRPRALQADADAGLVAKPSRHGVPETIARLEAVLKAKGITVFARVDHSGEAEKAGLKMRPTQLLVFGNPKAGTRLMQDSQAIALDLPLRVSVWEDERGRVWASYRALDRLADDYAIKDKAAVTAMERALETLVGRTLDVYEE